VLQSSRKNSSGTSQIALHRAVPITTIMQIVAAAPSR
jgi:hypothetical protein